MDSRLSRAKAMLRTSKRNATGTAGSCSCRSTGTTTGAMVVRMILLWHANTTGVSGQVEVHGTGATPVIGDTRACPDCDAERRKDEDW